MMNMNTPWSGREDTADLRVAVLGVGEGLVDTSVVWELGQGVLS